MIKDDSSPVNPVPAISAWSLFTVIKSI